jgi:hypothetical protein
MTARTRKRRRTNAVAHELASPLSSLRVRMCGFDKEGLVSEREKILWEGAEEFLWTKEPDWTCPRCQSVNRGVRDICRICGLDSALLSGGNYFPVEKSQSDVPQNPGEAKP